MAKDLQQNICETREIVLKLLFTDLDLALTFLNTARISGFLEVRKRNIENAAKAYRYVSAKAPDVPMSENDRKELEAGLCDLGAKLIEFGVPIYTKAADL